MSFNIIPTPPFQKELKLLAKKYPFIKNDLAELSVKLQEDPQMGTHLEMIVIKSEWLYLQKVKVNPVAQEL
jgi:mRNA-degrading endonuclease RelE of RelBE toxin-antitoxin system